MNNKGLTLDTVTVTEVKDFIKEKPAEHAIRDHAILGGSKASIWCNCPGSVFFQKDLPPEVANQYAEEGTKAHEVAEMVLSDFLDYKLTGSDPEIRAHLTASDDEMVEGAKGYCKAIWEKVLEGALTGKAYGLEERFVISERNEMYGYVDFWAAYIDDRGKRCGWVVDYKYGFNPVEIKNNAQLAFYALALREEMKRGGKDLDYVKAAIYQPRAAGNSYKETKFSANQLDIWKKKFLKAADLIFVKQKPIFRVGSHCRWCRAQGICPAYAKSISAENNLALFEPDIKDLPVPQKIEDAVLARLILGFSKFEDFIGKCKEYAKERCLSNNPIKGLKCVLGTTKRTWLDDDKAIAAGLAKVGVKEVFNQKLKGITEIEKELKKLHGVPDAKSIMESFTTRTIPAVIVVSEADERPPCDSGEHLLNEGIK
jgi:hypothetical protein